MKLSQFEKDLIIFSLEELGKKVLSEKFDVFYELTLNDKEEIDEYTQYEKIKEVIKKIEKTF